MSIADGFVSQRPRMSAPISIYQLKSTGESERLCGALKAGQVVPLARTKTDGTVISEIAYAVPKKILAAQADTSDTSYEWRTFRRNPREAAEAARLRQRALLIEGLDDDDGEGCAFYVVPDDSEALFSAIDEDREAVKVAALRRIAAAMEEFVGVMRGRLPPPA